MPHTVTPTSPYRYPVALNLTGKRCVVVGAGSVGTRKAEALRVAGADVVVLSLETTGAFAPAQLNGAFLVIAATDDKSVNSAIMAAAQERGVLCNNAAPEDGDLEDNFGDFVTMAQISDGDLLIGITTGGAGPSVTAKIKTEIEKSLGDGWGDFLALYREMRQLAKMQIVDRATRVARLRELAASTVVWNLVRTKEYDKAKTEAEKCLL
jgi:precorrin-2 dehydrogenase / sirohydrochlorin ferrochelatase